MHYLKTSTVLLYGGALMMLITVMLIPFFWSGATDYFVALTKEYRTVAGPLFMVIMFLATVVAPITASPMIPMVSPIIGPLQTALYSIVGWSAGAVVAFCIARYGGKPLLKRVVSLKQIEYYERALPRQTQFWGLVLLRVLFPVDILSYAVGFLSTIGFVRYTVATVIGVSPFSFIFAYASSAAFNQQYLLFGAFVFAGVALLGMGSWAYWYLRRRGMF